MPRNPQALVQGYVTSAESYEAWADRAFAAFLEKEHTPEEEARVLAIFERWYAEVEDMKRKEANASS